MVTMLTGQVESTDISAIQKKNMAEAIMMLEPANVPLSVLLNKLPKEKTTNPKFEWNEKEKVPYWDMVNLPAGYAAGDTSIAVDNFAYYSIGDLIKFPRTGEVARVTACTASPITIVRGAGALALLDNEPIMILAGSNEEGSSYPEAKMAEPESGYNYTQILKDTLKFTGTQTETEYYGGDPRASERALLAIAHTEKIERAIWFNTRTLVTGTNARRTTGGVFQFLTTNVTNAGGILTEASFEEYLETAFQYGSLEKFAFCSARVLSVISMWGKHKMTVLPKDKTYGLVITQYVSPHGILNLIRHPMFSGAVYGYYMAILDLADQCIRYRFMRNRDTKLYKDAQAKGIDGVVDYFQTECGIAFKAEKRHQLITNIQM